MQRGAHGRESAQQPRAIFAPSAVPRQARNGKTGVPLPEVRAIQQESWVFQFHQLKHKGKRQRA